MSDFQFYPVMFSTRLWSEAVVLRFSEQILQHREHIYHYTMTEGLKGIVETNSLWATSAYYLNDTSEIEYGCRLAIKILDQNFSEASSGFAKMALHHAGTILGDPSQREVRASTIYVTCFCESDNLLSQWRAYGHSGGFSVRFRSRELRFLAPEHITAAVGKVLYEKDDQINLLRDMVAAAVSVLGDTSVVRGYDNAASSDSVREAGEIIAQVLLSMVTCFKAPDFREEQEWRLV